MSSNLPSQEPEDKKKSEEPDLNKKDNNNFDDLYSYAKTNPRDIIAYALLILGIILLFFQPIYGGLLIGCVVGIYFAHEIADLLKNLEALIEREGLVRSLVIGGTVLAFFISAPAIFIGAAIVIGIKLFLIDKA